MSANKELVLAHEIARLYDQAHDACTAAGDALPRDIRATWPNVLGFLRRIPGQRYHRPGPNGREDVPTEREIEAFVEALRFHKSRAEAATKTVTRLADVLPKGLVK